MHDGHSLVELWRTAVTDFTSLVRELPEEAWHLPTDLPGWDVAAVVAHTAHLEAIVAGAAHEDVEIGQPEHVTGPMGVFTEQGVASRRTQTRVQLLAEIADATATRYAELSTAPPDPAAPAPGAFGLIGWSNATLLKNRPLDIWMHEQDLRRATDLPGGLDGPVADYVVGYFLGALGYVLSKKVGAPVGTSVRIIVEGSDPVTVEIAEDGRGRPATVDTPTATLRLRREDFIVLAGGRRTVDDVHVATDGDARLGAAVAAHLAVTP